MNFDSEFNEKQEIYKLIEQINRHDYLYYSLDNPEIDDDEYDMLRRKLHILVKKYPDLEHIASQTLNKVGAKPSEKLAKITYKVPMLSLDNAFSAEDVEEFLTRVRNYLSLGIDDNISLTAEPKIDGLSLSLRYEKGILVQASTRGDGTNGENVTQNAKMIADIPLKLHGKNIPDILEVRGECYMQKSDFFALNNDSSLIISADSKQKSKFATPRNAAAGSLRQLDTDIIAERKLRFFVYAWGEISYLPANSQFGMIEKFAEYGFIVNPMLKLCYSLQDLLDHYEYIKSQRDELNYDIDGVVYKINDLQQQKRLGAVSRAPRWAIAHKFPAEKKITKINKIDVQVGRTGVLTPVAILEPVTIGGVTITRATLHNEDYIAGRSTNGKIIREGRDIRVGDTVIIQRAGDVIPQVVDVIIEKRQLNSEPFRFPNNCPVCGSPIVKEEGENIKRCTGFFNCSAQAIERLKHFVSRDAFNIEGLAEKKLKFLFEIENEDLKIKNPVDIFTLEKRQKNSLQKLDKLYRFGEDSVKNLFNAINNSRLIPLYRFIYALGIPHIGLTTSKNIAEQYLTYENFLQAVEQRLLVNIDSLGEIMAEAIYQFFAETNNINLLDNLLKEITILPQERIIIEKDSPIAGKTIVFTGSLNNMSRSEAKTQAKRLGAKVVSAISSKVDILIIGEKSSSKKAKAELLNIQIMPQDEWFKILKEYQD
ncbi:NAD-dependent DNA ligase LigA [Bartonella sp. DGB1]|uniref:NAD-dependent DNA ligase LigA n=1 Tax=Bartonella sp. DGB1 TaxID=3239807 RepID=UPI003526BF37